MERGWIDDNETMLTDDKPSWSDFVDDTIGLNLKGLKTLLVSVIEPKQFFEAARTAQWSDNQFSPSVRIWIFLLAVLMFFQFIWATPDSLFGKAFIENLEASSNDTNSIDSANFEFVLSRYLLIYPSLLLCGYLLSGFILRIWGKGTSSVVSMRLFFCAALPGMLLILAVTILSPVLSPPYQVMAYAIGFVGNMLLSNVSAHGTDLGLG